MSDVIFAGSEDCLLYTSVVAKVEELAELAPLHNPAHIIGYNAFKNALPGVEHVFVFDTAFHQTLDQERYLYPLPCLLYTSRCV